MDREIFVLVDNFCELNFANLKKIFSVRFSCGYRLSKR